jgi:hypothetical protein
MSASDAIVARPARISELGRRGALGALTGARDLKRELEELGIRRSRSSNAPVLALAGLLVVSAGSATIGAVTHSLSADTAVGLAAAVLTVAGVLVAVLQWRLGLSEKAFDALYSRIALANEMRLAAFKDLRSGTEEAAAAERPELYRFFVFTEIDSLEYAARRYRFGLGVNDEIVGRALRHFKVRCGSETFRSTALACVRDSAHFAETKCMVESIVTKASEEHATR